MVRFCVRSKYALMSLSRRCHEKIFDRAFAHVDLHRNGHSSFALAEPYSANLKQSRADLLQGQFRLLSEPTIEKKRSQQAAQQQPTQCSKSAWPRGLHLPSRSPLKAPCQVTHPSSMRPDSFLFAAVHSHDYGFTSKRATPVLAGSDVMTKKPLSAAELTEMIVGLNRLARNLWWTWNQESQEIFQELSPRGWQNLYHNAVAVLHEVSDYELRVRLQDPDFAERVRSVLRSFDDYLKEKNTWAHQHASALLDNPVAYFTAEFGFHETLPIAAGGLGILAGDHAKSASDLGL